MNTDVRLNKVMSIKDYFMLGFGSMVGVGWCVAINDWISAGGGVLITVSTFLIVTVMIIPIGLCYAEMCPAFPVAGGVFAYSYKAFGRKIAFITGWLALLAYVNVMPWESIYINDVFCYLFPSLKAGSPLYVLGNSPVYTKSLVLGILVSLVMIFINWRGTKFASTVQNACCYLMIGGAVIVVVFAFAKCDFSNLFPLHRRLSDNTGAGIGACIIAVASMAPFHFSGFDTICQSAEESEMDIDYKKMGKVIFIGIVATGIYYSLMLMSAGVAYPADMFVTLKRPSICYMFLLLYPGMTGRILYFITLITALAGLFSTWNGFYMAGARLCLGMGRAGFLPGRFKIIHEKNRTPVAGNVVCGIACIAGPFIGIGYILPLSIIGSFAFVACWFFTALSCWKLRVADPDLNRPFRMPGGTIIMKIACLSSALMALICVLPNSPGFMGMTAVYYLAVWLIIGLIIYISMQRKKTDLTEGSQIENIFRILSDIDIDVISEYSNTEKK